MYILPSYRYLPLLQYPFFPITLALIAGICWQSAELTAFLPLICICLGVCWLQKEHTSKNILIFLGNCAFFGCGAFLYQRQMNQYEDFYTITHNQEFDLVATVTDITPIMQGPYKYCLNVSVDALHNECTQKQFYNDTQLLLYTNNAIDLLAQDRIQINSVHFPPLSNESFKKYLIKEGVCGSLSLPAMQYTLMHRPPFSMARWLTTKKHTLFACLKEKMSSKTFALFASLFLGNKKTSKYHNTAINRKFKLWGLSHYLARSGLHLVLLLLFLDFFLRCLPLPFLLKQTAIIAISMIYAILSWSSTSFMRGYNTFLLYRFCVILKEQINSLHMIMFVTFVMLCHNPLLLFFLDFQLSFGLTAALSLINQSISFGRHSTNS